MIKMEQKWLKERTESRKLKKENETLIQVEKDLEDEVRSMEERFDGIRKVVEKWQ